MSVLFRIVYAAHANGTHHKLALDALNHMQRRDADDWRRVFLKHVGKYLDGAKAPDVTFKDFKNHVLHVGDDYWGGAPEKVEEWYATTVTALRAGEWEAAAYAAGVLSHYYTDPVMPFHTGQTEAENAIHRATEWSINRSYNALRVLGEQRFAATTITPRDGADWLKEMTCDGAETAHRQYEKLIAHYDIHKGVVEPTDGLDAIARPIVAELLMYAAEGFGHLLDRAIGDAAITAPDVTLTAETVLAALQIPRKMLEKRLSNAEDRKIVQAMYDELKTTGRVDKSLPEDDRIIRDLHAAEVLAPKLANRALQRAQRLPGKYDPLVVTNVSRFEQALAEHPIAQRVAPRAMTSTPPPLPPSHTATLAPVVSAAADRKSSAPAALPAAEPNPAPQPVAVAQTPLALPPRGTFAKTKQPEAGAASPAPTVEAVAPDLQPAARRDDARRNYLSATDPLEDAPSIGPKMAERFAGLGITTVGDFLGQDPHDIAELLDDARLDAETIIEWQDQAQLVIDIAGLRGGGAQLLVGAGYRTRDAIADADPVALSADILTFATTSHGKRILRDGNPPDIEKIKDWVQSARAALAA